VILVEVDVMFGCALRVDDPDGGLLWESEGKQIERRGEVFEGSDEAEGQVGLRGDAGDKCGGLREIADQFFEAVGGGDEGYLHVAADA